MVAITRPGRLAAIDIARGVALIAMTIYHFTWDLEFFGWAPPGTSVEIGWRLFARAIASSFLFLVGISLVLAHGEGIRWSSFWKRFAMVAGAAALISLVTYFAIPGGFIFFGILHAIALFSLIGLAVLRLPWWANAAAAFAIIAMTEPLRTPLLDAPFLWWIGLMEKVPVSNDFVPLFPWMGATLLGIAVAQLARSRRWFELLEGRGSGGAADRSLGFIGRHSLVFYLVHQPILIASIWAFTQIAGPPDATPRFLAQCERTCTPGNEAAFCNQFCNCMAEGLKEEGLFTPFMQGEVDLSTDPTGNEVLEICSAR